MFNREEYIDSYGLQVDPLFDIIDGLQSEISDLKLRVVPHKVLSDIKMATINRDIDICSEYQDGLTLQNVADLHDITRERVRQILVKNNVNPKNGGSSKTARIGRAKRLTEKSEKYMAKYGCSISEYKQLVKNGMTLTYKNQRFNSIRRDIPWEFKLWDWYVIWRDSGKLPFRGRKKGQYVMARFNDVGPYSKDNVKIITCSENIIEVRRRERSESRLHKTP